MSQVVLTRTEPCCAKARAPTSRKPHGKCIPSTGWKNVFYVDGDYANIVVAVDRVEENPKAL